MSESNVLTWPDRLTLRDTKVIADEGQRIFTTATGYGYSKQEYVKAEVTDAMVDRALKAELPSHTPSVVDGWLHYSIKTKRAIMRAALNAALQAEGRTAT
jgi:hypothetical protein